MTGTRVRRRVPVAGAGIAGLAVVRALRGRGVLVDVVERNHGPTDVGAGLFLPGNAVRALRALQLDEAVAGQAVRIERQRVTDHRGRTLYEVGTSSLWPGNLPTLATRRSAMHAALLQGTGDVEIRWGTSPSEIATGGPGVEVTFDDGSSGRYDLVIGADGVHSTVRRLVFGEVGLRAPELYAWRLVAPRRHADQVWSVRLGRQASFLSLPVSEDLDYYYLDTTVTDAEEGLAAVAARFDGRVSTMTAAADLAHQGPIQEVVLDSWTRGRVLLIGDAAHATSPSMAQGAAMALEDALVLAQVLGSDPGIPDALQAYERRRRPRVDWVRRQTRQRDRTRGTRPLVRNLVLRAVGRRLFRTNYRGLHPGP